MTPVYISGPFDDLRFLEYRFIAESAALGFVHAFLWSDELVKKFTGAAPKFPLSEREYTLQANRHVSKYTIVGNLSNADSLPDLPKGIWVETLSADNSAKESFAKKAGHGYRVLPHTLLNVAPPAPPTPANPRSSNKKVIVTGCFDWFHSGHVRFFEEVSELGDLYVIVGHDENLRLLKGPGHPLFPAVQRRFITDSIRYVKQSIISTGHGWMDAEPEINVLKPDIYAVNEDGDKPEKREFCKTHNLEYCVLKRLPKPGLTRRQSTSLRGF
jgi:cytidyltransferase-like protein